MIPNDDKNDLRDMLVGIQKAREAAKRMLCRRKKDDSTARPLEDLYRTLRHLERYISQAIESITFQEN